MMPIAVAAGSFVHTALVSVYIVDVFILKVPTPLTMYEYAGAAFMVMVYSYTLYYCRSNLEYFTDKSKYRKHLLYLIIIPALCGIYSGYSSYIAKSAVSQKMK